MCSQTRNSCAKVFGNRSRRKNLKPKNSRGGQFDPPPLKASRVKRLRGKSIPLFEATGELNDKLPKTIKESPGKNMINNLTLEILTENLETPDFGDNEITYVLKIW